MIHTRLTLSLGVVLAGWFAVHAQGETTNLTVDADTFILESHGDNNAGAHAHITAGTSGQSMDNRRRALYRFDVNGIPAGSTVTSATFRADVIETPGFGAVNSNFAIHRVLADWNEGTKFSSGGDPGDANGNFGAAATNGEVTWNSRQHGVASWTTAGGDFAAGASASTAITGIGSYEWTSAQVVADVQAWIDNTSTNQGWMLITESEGTQRTARRFGSKDGGSAATLEIGFMLPAPVIGSSFTSIDASAAEVTVQFQSLVGRTYTVERTGDVKTGTSWESLQSDIAGDGSVLSVTDTDGLPLADYRLFEEIP